MRRRALLALALVACSEALPRAAGSDASAEASPPAIDAGSVGDAGTDACEAGCGSWCAKPIRELDIFPFEENDWASPDAPHAACTSEELASLESVLAASARPTRGAIEAAVGATCRACVVSEDWSDDWGPFVAPRGAPPTTPVFFNFGACHAVHEGSACGRAVTVEAICKAAACATCDAAGNDACRAAAETGACRELTPARKAACPAYATTSARCASIMEVVRLLCAPPSDAGAGDAG